MPIAASNVCTWPRYPLLYEINTWVWLADLSRKHGRPLDLGSVPAQEWDAIAACGFDAVWLMGVWQRSPAGIAIANQNPGLLADFRRALPDFRSDDNVGSPYCIRNYAVDPHLGGRDALAAARRELHARGIKLILDFVPNHVAPDHPWVAAHPEYFVRGTADDAQQDPASFIEVSGTVFARGRDPYFPAWPDVLQLNAFDPGLREAVNETLSDIAAQCDGVRCDMAMLPMSATFTRTWGSRAGPPPQTEYWVKVIGATKREHPCFLFIGEAYWDLEWELQQQGFDFCYDKKLYDRLAHENAESVRLHLSAGLDYQNKLLRFIENHDEPRAAAKFDAAKHRAVAVTLCTLPGIRMLHEGQLEGRAVRLPVFLGQRPDEPPHPELHDFYRRLLQAIDRPAIRDGDWSLCTRSGWPDNTSCDNLVAWTHRFEHERFLTIVNLSEASVQARLHVPWPDAGGATWDLHDLMSGVTYERGGDEIASQGLYVDLPPWGCHLFHCIRKDL